MLCSIDFQKNNPVHKLNDEELLAFTTVRRTVFFLSLTAMVQLTHLRHVSTRSCIFSLTDGVCEQVSLIWSQFSIYNVSVTLTNANGWNGLMVAPVALLRTVKKEMRSRALVKSSTYSYAHKVTYPLQNFFNLELHRLFDKYLHIHLHKISQVHKNKWIYTCILKIHLHSVKFFFFFYILFLSLIL